MRTWQIGIGLIAGGLLLLSTGCVSVKAPERVEIGTGGRTEAVDSSEVPNPRTLEEARYELRKAYGRIRYLEGKVDDLEEDKAECKRDKERYKKERDRYKKRLKKYEDD